MHFADAPGSSRRPSSPPTLPPEVRYYLLLDLNGTLCDRVRAPCASKIEQNVIVFREGVEDFLRYCWCCDPPPSPSLTSTFTCVYERLTSLTGGVHDDG